MMYLFYFQDPPETVTVGPAKPYIVVEGRSATLKCSAGDANPSAIEFRFKADDKNWGGWSSTNKLEVYSQTPRGTHTGRCKARNSIDEGPEDTLNIVVHCEL